eukprot:scaffold582623_cov39-Prasinocladus_malaysianus.AAC.1
MFEDNIAEAKGGAVALEVSKAEFKECNFNRNRALDSNFDGTDEEGGALFVIGSAAALAGAGAIDVRNSRAKMASCVFADNSAADVSDAEDQWGGAVRILDPFSEVDFDSCEFTNNTADYGGAVFAGVGSGVLFTKSTFSQNSARVGGAIRVESAAE